MTADQRDRARRRPRPRRPSSTPPWEAVRDQLRTDRGPDVLAASQFVFDSPYVPTGEPLRRLRRAVVPAGPADPGGRPRPDRADPRRVPLRPDRDDDRHADQGGARAAPRRLPGLRPPPDRLPALAGPGRPLRQRLPRARPRLPAARASSAPRPRTPGSRSSAPASAGSTSTRPTTRSPTTSTSSWPGAATTTTSAPSRASSSAAATHTVKVRSISCRSRAGRARCGCSTSTSRRIEQRVAGSFLGCPRMAPPKYATVVRESYGAMRPAGCPRAGTSSPGIPPRWEQRPPQCPRI